MQNFVCYFRVVSCSFSGMDPAFNWDVAIRFVSQDFTVKRRYSNAKIVG